MKKLIGFKEQILYPLALLALLASCNQQEFYEKDFLEGVGVDQEVDLDINIPADSPEEPVAEVPTGTSTPSVPVTTENPVPEVPQTPEVPEALSQVDSFVGIADIQKAKVDILWVIDDSGSMRNEQEAIARNFDIFIKDFLEQDIDFQMGITTTDARSSKIGRQIGDLSKLNSAYAKEDKWAFINYFAQTILVGTKGSGSEKGLLTASEYLKTNSNFLRKDAYLAIVYVSDEQDQSSNSVEFYKEDLLAHKKNNGLVKTYSIVNTNLNGLRRSHYLGSRYMEMSEQTNGVVGDIREDFYSTLKNFGEEITILLDSFALSKNAQIGTVQIKVDGQEVTSGWSYDSFNNTVKFEKSSAPAQGSEIKITYSIRE